MVDAKTAQPADLEIPICEPAEAATTGPLWLARYSRLISALLFCNCLIIATLTFAGWLFGVPAMYAVFSDSATMKINNALCILILGAIGLSYLSSRSAAKQLVMTGLVFVIVLALFTVLQYLLGIDFGIDELLAVDASTDAANNPGRMSLASALGLITAATAFGCLYLNKIKAAQILSAMLAGTGVLVLTAYLFDQVAIESFFPFSSLSLNTGIAFTSLGLALLFAESEKAYLRFLYYESSGGLLAQRYVPYALLIPFVAAGAIILGEYFLGYDAHFGLFLLSTSISVLFLFLLSRMSKYVHQLELEGHREDIRERMTAERIAQLQRIHSMGLVAGGIAHDFKNLLMPIIWSADLGLSLSGQSEENLKRYRVIRESAGKASALAEKMMELGKSQPMRFQILNINHVLKDMKSILEGMSKGGVVIDFQLGEDLEDVIADKSQLEQVLINLTKNACQAMNDSGRLLISTSQCGLNQNQMTSLSASSIEHGEYICLAVSDEGVGMSEEELTRVLEPFYSTKEIGEGHGLGLSTVNDIVLQHLGILDIVSKPGEGTTVLIYIPVRVQTKIQLNTPESHRRSNGNTPTASDYFPGNGSEPIRPEL